jgi:hypothetical protein
MWMDLDEDGDLDVVATSWLANAVAWFENPLVKQRDPSVPFPRPSDRKFFDTRAWEGKPWIKHMIDPELPESRTVRFADFNADGYPDLLSTGSKKNLVVWYQHPGADPTSRWRRRVIDGTLFLPRHGHPVDMDGDGDMDVVMAGGMPDDARGAVVWYENDGKPAAGAWTRHAICDHLPSAFEAFPADLDGDGNFEVAATRWGPQGGLDLFRHAGDPSGPWQRQKIKEGWSKANQVIIADLDGDKRPDILAEAERGANECRWWRNLGRKRE